MINIVNIRFTKKIIGASSFMLILLICQYTENIQYPRLFKNQMTVYKHNSNR